MATSADASVQLVRFSVYEVDAQAGELRRNGAKVRLEGQPLTILLMLLERPGEVVTREELKQRLWPGDTFVDFEHSINVAVKRLREALQDSATSPRFIETLPRRGYRFIYPLSAQENGAAPAIPHVTPWLLRPWVMGGSVALAAAVVVAVLIATNPAGLRERVLGSTAAGEIRSLAVLPLRNLTGDPERDDFAAGMTEMLITELGRAGSPQIKSHQSVLQYLRTDKPLPQIARELNVDVVIEGRLLRTQNGFRVTINVVQADPERHILAETYDCDERKLFLLLDDVAKDVLKKIRVTLPPEQQRHFAKSRAVDPEVNEAYVKGLHHLRRGTDADRAKAHEYFAKATQKDPDFALAYAGMALLDAHGGAYRGAGAGPEFRDQAEQWALRALALDDTLAEAHTALAWLKFFFDWDFPGAEREFQRAIALNPNFVTARIWYVSYLAAMRRIQEADFQAQAALQIEPASVSVVTHAALHYLCSNRIDRAIELYRQALELEPNYHAAHWFLGKAYVIKGMYPQAVAEVEQAAAEGGRNPANLALLAYVYARAGRRDEAQHIVAELESQEKDRVLVAVAYVALGNKDRALELLETAFERRRQSSGGKGGNVRGAYLVMLNADPLFELLRDDPRFQKLTRQIGLPDLPTQARN